MDHAYDLRAFVDYPQNQTLPYIVDLCRDRFSYKGTVQDQDVLIEYVVVEFGAFEKSDCKVEKLYIGISRGLHVHLDDGEVVWLS